MLAQSVRNFMLQQGFAEEPADACNMRFEGLYFQPRVVFGLVLIAVVFQEPAIFLGLATVLFWNVLFPALNPFELFYNRWIARPRGRQSLTPAPAPRRFAQAVNGLFNLASGVLLPMGFATASWIVQALLVGAFSLLLFARFCLGAYVFHLLRGERVRFRQLDAALGQPRSLTLRPGSGPPALLQAGLPKGFGEAPVDARGHFSEAPPRQTHSTGSCGLSRIARFTSPMLSSGGCPAMRRW